MILKLFLINNIVQLCYLEWNFVSFVNKLNLYYCIVYNWLDAIGIKRLLSLLKIKFFVNYAEMIIFWGKYSNQFGINY